MLLFVVLKVKIAEEPCLLCCNGRNGEARLIEVHLSHELYQAAENMYVSLNLPNIIADLILSLDPSLHRRLLSNIVLTGGNSRLNGLPFRLVRDLEAVLPASLASCVHVVDPRLMTGRSDAVIGAAYVRKWSHATWTTRRDYILRGLGDPPSNVTRSQLDGVHGSSDDTASVVSSSSAVTPDDVVPRDGEDWFSKLNELHLSPDHCDVEKSSVDEHSTPRPLPQHCCCTFTDSECSHIGLCDIVASSIL